MKYRFILIILLLPIVSYSQISHQEINDLITHLAKDLRRQYIDSLIGEKMADFITAKSNQYDTAINQDELAYFITSDLRRISNDKHIYVQANPTKEKKTHGYEVRRYRRNCRKSVRGAKTDNLVYGAIKTINDEVGYIDINEFSDNEMHNSYNSNKRIPLKRVMNFVNKTQYLIIDLRNCQGGLLQIGSKLMSYIVDSNKYICTAMKKHFTSSNATVSTTEKQVFSVKGNSSSQSFKNKKILILTSSRTFSTGEFVIYGLKKYANVTVIGENTAGGAYSWLGGVGYEKYRAKIPDSKLGDTTNNFTWEGYGIKPDIFCPADSTYKLALSKIYNKQDINKLQLKEKYLKKRKIIHSGNPGQLSEYVGNYMKVVIEQNKDVLYLINDLESIVPLEFVEKDCYKTLRGVTITFNRDNNNKISRILVKYRNGITESYKRIN